MTIRCNYFQLRQLNNTCIGNCFFQVSSAWCTTWLFSTSSSFTQVSGMSSFPASRQELIYLTVCFLSFTSTAGFVSNSWYIWSSALVFFNLSLNFSSILFCCFVRIPIVLVPTMQGGLFVQPIWFVHCAELFYHHDLTLTLSVFNFLAAYSNVDAKLQHWRTSLMNNSTFCAIASC